MNIRIKSPIKTDKNITLSQLHIDKSESLAKLNQLEELLANKKMMPDLFKKIHVRDIFLYIFLFAGSMRKSFNSDRVFVPALLCISVFSDIYDILWINIKTKYDHRHHHIVLI